MRQLRRMFLASVFTLTLALPAFAGQIEIGYAPPPPLPPQAVTKEGQIETGVTGQEEAVSSEAIAADSVTESVLNLLQSVLSLF
jgi:hypothetical protein